VYGLFTWKWAEALQQARPGETWKELFKKSENAGYLKKSNATSSVIRHYFILEHWQMSQSPALNSVTKS
jgi:hypothetical protein